MNKYATKEQDHILKVGKTCRLPVDDYKNKAKVKALSKGLTIMIATDEDGNEIGQIYVRVRAK